MKRTIVAVAALLGLAPVTSSPLHAQQAPRRYQNLQVLAPDITDEELSGVMVANTLELGLPRLAGEGCLFCHVGDLEQPRSDWDFASDAKPTKRKARAMMAMVRAINEEHLAGLESRIGASVRCATCHAGRTDPRPLEERLWSHYERGGLAETAAEYRALRERHLGGDAYDFRAPVLPRLARRIADEGGGLDDAIAVAALNREFHPDDVGASRSWLLLVLERAERDGGAEAALAELEARRGALGARAAGYELLDALGWHLYRQDRRESATRILGRNRELFPEEYVPTESVAFIEFEAGDREQAFAILERWLEQHPDHDRARRLLTNLRAEPE